MPWTTVFKFLRFPGKMGITGIHSDVCRRIVLLLPCFLLVLSLYLCVVAAEESEQTVGCILTNQTSCPTDHCCVKQVITFKDPRKSAIVNTVCQPLLTDGAMCLRNPEGYMCDCALGLKCSMADYQTFGHCRRVK